MRRTPARLGLAVLLLAALAAAQDPAAPTPPAPSDCPYDSFLDALGGTFSDTSIFETAVKASGYADKLPKPNGPLKLTMLVPTNKAFMSLLWKNGMFLSNIGSVGDALPAIMLYNVMVGAVSPTQLQNYTRSEPGSAATANSLLGGNGGSLAVWAEYAGIENDQPKYYNYFKPSMNDGLAGAGTYKDVCGSWIYITDEVLVPTDNKKIGGVQKVTIPDSLFGGGGGDGQTSPAVVPPDPPTVEPTPPVPAPVPEPPTCVLPSPTAPVAPTPPATPPTVAPTAPTPAPAPTCSTTLADAAKANGLSILAAALGQDALGSQMPDPSTPHTFLAPVDTAFLSLLPALNITIDQALALGDKLAGVILYHVVPDKALSIADLAGVTALDTALGARTGTPEAYTVGVQAAPDGVSTQLVGKRTGNVALVQKEFTLCASTVIVIDAVLLPAETVDTLPSPTPGGTTADAPAPSTSLMSIKADIAPAPGSDLTLLNASADDVTAITDLANTVVTDVLPATGILDAGLATAVGPLINCIIRLAAVGGELVTTTDSNGRFTFPGVPDCALSDAQLTLPAGAEQLATCVDSATGLQPPYSLSALLSQFLGAGALNGAAPNASSADFPINLSPLTDLLTSMTGNGSSPDAANITSAAASALGFTSEASAAFGDFVGMISDNKQDSLASILGSTQTLISQVIGGNVLTQLIPGIDVDAAAKAVGAAAAGDPSALGALATPETISKMLQAGFNLLSGSSDSASSLFGGSRKLLQGPAPAPTTDLSAVFAAVAQPTAQLNLLAEQAAADGVLTTQEIADLMARCSRVAQLQVGPAAGDLAAGGLDLAEFQTSFSNEQVTKAVEKEQIVLEPIEEPATVIAPAPPTPAASAAGRATALVGAMSALALLAMM